MIRPHYQFALVAMTMLWSFAAGTARAQSVPGQGTRYTFDDFEDPNWGFNYNLPKSSKEEDEQVRYPLAVSTNNQWKEGPKRGCPDVVKVVDAPAGGIAGSKHALLLRSRDTGIPGRLSYSQKQDDFVMVSRTMGVASAPSTVVRVYFPEWEQWENRHGVHFGIRLGLQGPVEKIPEDAGRMFRRSRPVTTVEPYYPGFFFQFNPKGVAGNDQPHAMMLIRADEYGRDLPGPKITQTGWWTFGMSVTPDARIHYYAKPGVADLTAADHLTSTLPYAIPGTHFNTLFFNTCSADDGRSWSTPILIDDPAIYFGQSGAPGQNSTAEESKRGFFNR